MNNYYPPNDAYWGRGEISYITPAKHCTDEDIVSRNLRRSSRSRPAKFDLNIDSGDTALQMREKNAFVYGLLLPLLPLDAINAVYDMARRSSVCP